MANPPNFFPLNNHSSHLNEIDRCRHSHIHLQYFLSLMENSLALHRVKAIFSSHS